MGNASVKAHRHKRSGYRNKHRRSGYGHKHNRFCTKRHHRYGGGLSPLNPNGKSKYISKPKRTVEIPLSKVVTINSAHKAQREGDAVRLKKTITERERTARREQFFKDVEERERERAIRLKTRKTPIIHTHSTRTLKRK